MRVVQLMNNEGDHVGLYLIYKTHPMDEIKAEIKDAFKKAKEKEDIGETDDLHSYADEILVTKRIFRVMAEEVAINEL